MRAILSSRSKQIVRDYIAWWARQMRDLLPEQLGGVGGETQQAVIVTCAPGGEALLASVRRDNQTIALGRFAPDRVGIAALREAAGLGDRANGVRLVVPPDALLEKPLMFPLAAERALRAALTYEMDRETPFAADEVWWNWRVDQRDKTLGQLRLTLFLIPKSAGQEIVSALHQGGLEAVSIGAAAPDGRLHEIALAGEAGAVTPQSGWVRPLAMACAALALVALVLPFARQSLALSHVDREIAALKDDVDAVQRLRRRLDSGAGAGSAAEIDRAGGNSLNVLAETTRILPDDTHLTDFTLHRRKLTLSGQSGDAARLIGLLAGDGFFKDPAFAAAVTRQPGSKLDSFAITAEVRP